MQAVHCHHCAAFKAQPLLQTLLVGRLLNLDMTSPAAICSRINLQPYNSMYNRSEIT